MKAKKYVKSTASMLAIKKYFNIKVIASLVAALMLLYTPVALYNYTKENGTLLYNVAEAQITSTVPIVKGKIKTEAFVEETSEYSVNNGFEEAEKNGHLNYTGTSNNNTNYQNSRPSSTPTYNQQNNNSNTQQTTNQVQKDLSLLKGTSTSIIEGEYFNPIINLGIVAHDKDGTDITDRVSIDENTVDVNNEGSYYVKASVKLNDGSILEKVFTVNVNPKKEVTYEVNNFEMLEKTAPKLGTARIFFDSKVSDDAVSPIKATVNGIEYNVNNFGKSSFGGTTRYYIDVNIGDISGEFKLNVEKVEFSNGVNIWPGKQMNVYVIKSEPVVSNFSYIEDEEGKISTTFDLKDLDNSLSNMKVSLYNEKGILVEEHKVSKKEKYNLDFSVEANGRYTLEVIGDVNLYDDSSRLNQNRVILSEDIQVSKIIDKLEVPAVDNSKLEANDIELSVGEELNIDDLNIVALDKNGEDISNKVKIDTSKLDINNAGEYEVLLTVINSDDTKLEKIVNIKVKDSRFDIYLENDKSYFEQTKSRSTSKLEESEDDYINKVRSVGNNTVVNGLATTPLHSDLKLTGTVKDANGNSPQGRIEVEIPSSVNFAVDELGNFIIANNYSINNRGSCPVDIYVVGFRESKISSDIFIKQNDVSSSDSRNVVNLDVSGNTGNKVRLYDSSNLNTKIGEVPSKSAISITFAGEAGKAENKDIDDNGVSEDFTLKFKVSKS